MKPNSSSETTGLRDYLGVLRARRGLVIAVTLSAVAIGLAYSLAKTPTYDATATVTFTDPTKPLSILAPGTQLPVDLNLDKTAAGNANTVTRSDVVAAVQKQLNNGMSIDQLKGDVNSTVQPTSDQIDITASTDN